jgi:hypothetical protein
MALSGADPATEQAYKQKTRVWIRIHVSPDPGPDPAFFSILIWFESGSGFGSGFGLDSDLNLVWIRIRIDREGWIRIHNTKKKQKKTIKLTSPLCRCPARIMS